MQGSRITGNNLVCAGLGILNHLRFALLLHCPLGFNQLFDYVADSGEKVGYTSEKKGYWASTTTPESFALLLSYFRCASDPCEWR